MSDHRERLIELQRRLYARNRRRIAEYQQVGTKGFEAYEAAYHADVEGYQSVSNLAELTTAMRDANIVLVADYHTLHLAQKTFLKLARRVRGKRTSIALEFFSAGHQEVLDAWIAGRIQDKTLLKRTRYTKRWPYDIWPHFQPIVELARRRGWSLVGIDGARGPGVSIAETDRRMAEVLVDHLEASPAKTRILTLVGELHLAQAHLPLAIKQVAEARGVSAPKVLVVLQNNDTIYWQLLAEQGHHEVEIVRIDDDRFCVVNTPPVMVQQSYLNWIEYQVDTVDHDHLERNFRHLLGLVARALGVRLPRAVRDLAIFGPDDPELADELEASELLEEFEERFAEGTRHNAWVIPSQGLVYLHNLSLNMVGEAAARLLHGWSLGRDPDRLGNFYGQVIHDAIGFFGSKVVNPKRKGKHVPYYRALLNSVRSDAEVDTDQLEAASAVLLHKAFEQGKRIGAFPKLFDLRPVVRERVRRRLGFMLGERLYYAYERGKVSPARLRGLMRFPLHDARQATALYFVLVREVDRVALPKRI
ncbi:MAG: ChaN family lipoprotein [Myxococcota bacterium]